MKKEKCSLILFVFITFDFFPPLFLFYARDTSDGRSHCVIVSCGEMFMYCWGKPIHEPPLRLLTTAVNLPCSMSSPSHLRSLSHLVVKCYMLNVAVVFWHRLILHVDHLSLLSSDMTKWEEFHKEFSSVKALGHCISQWGTFIGGCFVKKILVLQNLCEELH